MANRLFIMGNGFDIEHGLKTSYKDFKEFIEANMDSYKTVENYSVIGPREQINDINNILRKDAEFILEAMDSCAGEDWKDLETKLGEALFVDYINGRLYSPEKTINDFIDKFVEWGNNIISESIKTTLSSLNALLYFWVDGCLKNGIDYLNIWKSKIYDVLDSNDLYLVLNYTLTLEKTYNIPSTNICHVHGVVGDKYEDIYFGHGNMEEIDFVNNNSTKEILNELKEIFRKDTDGAYIKHIDFFDRLYDIKEIYSFGSSFSSVDMFYVEKIIERVNANDITWYFNDFDQNNNADKKGDVERYGFMVEDTDRW